jgi:hypothetical protein
MKSFEISVQLGSKVTFVKNLFNSFSIIYQSGSLASENQFLFGLRPGQT